jgi:hypothetical protein
LEPRTQLKITNAVNRTFTDLSVWLRRKGLPQAEAWHDLTTAMHENGIMAHWILQLSSSILAVEGVANPQPAQVAQVLPWVQSGEFSTWLMSLPEPTPEELEQALRMIKNALPNLRKHFLSSAKVGPRYKRGGRPRELTDPAEREKIRQTIMSLRRPGTRLQDLFKRVAQMKGVSPAAIKRVWVEKIG